MASIVVQGHKLAIVNSADCGFDSHPKILNILLSYTLSSKQYKFLVCVSKTSMDAQ